MSLARALSATLAFISALGVASAQGDTPSLLIFSKTEGYRHDSIPDGINLVTSIANDKGWSVAASEDSSIFTQGLSNFTTLVFVSTTGNFLSADESAALEDFLLNGGSWLGIHAAADFGNDMPDWFSGLVGGQFLSHPCGTSEACSNAQRERYPPGGNVRPDDLLIQTHDHPSTSNLPSTHNRVDEWYSFKTNVADFPDNYTILTTLAETYIDEITLFPEREHMEPHPISWFSVYKGRARAFYTGQGHTVETYYEPYFIDHITGALEWVTGEAD
ncbi:secreted glycosyl hydrolase [Stachybotrys elegans]|uniref:Secreted glycosyl hydrolase n=1 Tax=Stachybotrys elegans TaxID=80388 RepID=A0A8K0SGU7_9HYPO|nr:secreted glycosyl hydrolase [Stachybotrys elegans]